VKRIYHHYEKWEDYKNGMWRRASKQEHDKLFKKAKEFTGNAELYGSWMLKVLDAWPFSCEQNLSDTGINRWAWIGHAAVSLALKIPESVVREAWFSLTNQQREDANKKADQAVQEWERRYDEKENSQLHFDLGETRVFNGYSNASR
jgi:hypothetical protein